MEAPESAAESRFSGKDAETEEKDDEAKTAAAGQGKTADGAKSGYRVLAVTACPTGIAHTYMAAESLENMAKKLGISCKVETDGSGGAQNVLTKEEIEAAEVIIVAADKNVGMARFNGKPVLLYPVIGIFLAAVVTTFINPYMGMINNALSAFLNGMGGTSRVVLGMVLGGMMSIDMGGPFNKAAYVFGTAQLAEGNFEVMASVMAGGMVPPIAIALCTTFFKKKFTEKERQSGLVNYVMGLSFITEGAIPFAAQDPLRVIPSCAIGAAVAGGLSMAFGCTLRAPHGGMFVLPTIGNPLMYLAAVVIGSVVGCVIMGLLKKDVEA